MKLLRAVGVTALLLLVSAGSASASAAGPGNSSAAISGQVTLGSQARWVSPVAINVQVSWECSDRFVAVLSIEVVQPSTLVVPTKGFAQRAVVCDGQPHTAAVTVHALVGTFQWDASGAATLTVLHGPPATFTDERPLQIVAR
jgi:hypothetical protein